MMLSTLLKTLLLPPAIQIMMILGGLLLWRRKWWLSRALVYLGVLSLWGLSLPVVSVYLHSSLEKPFMGNVAAQQLDHPPEGVEAIVVLGAGRHYAAEEYGGDTVSHSALWRLRYAGYLAKRWDLPVIVSGGSVRSFDVMSEADMGINFLRDELDVTLAWPEGNSRNTWENAFMTKALLDERGITKVALVTHAYHMQRSVYSFEQAGIPHIPMPTGFSTYQATSAFWLHWLPSATAMQRSYLALHEYMGLLFYRVK